MKREFKVISMQRALSLRLDSILTGEEAIVLRALAGGRTDRQVCNQLRMNPDVYLRMMRDRREKIGMSDNVALISWAKYRIQGVDQRIDTAKGRPQLG
jgi:DNA-binding CsgD family transcriptional regulator